MTTLATARNSTKLKHVGGAASTHLLPEKHRLDCSHFKAPCYVALRSVVGIWIGSKGFIADNEDFMRTAVRSGGKADLCAGERGIDANDLRDMDGSVLLRCKQNAPPDPLADLGTMYYAS